MSSDESPLDHHGASDAPESLDVTFKKKKSFHPIRSLKRLFAHGNGGSSSRQHSTDVSGTDSSMLIKAKSTTDVLVVRQETDEKETSDGIQKSSKQISLSADSIFSVERNCEPSLQVSAISSEALQQHDVKDVIGMSLRCKDDDEGFPQSPFNVATSSDLFIENGLKEKSDKWPSFDSGHSLLSVDSNENDVEEDFFKDKWLLNSKAMVLQENTEDYAPGAGTSLEGMDLNLVQHHSRLISSAAVHRLAIRPRGKRMSAVYQQKLAGALPKSPVPVTSLPLVEEESTSSASSTKEVGHSQNEKPETVNEIVVEMVPTATENTQKTETGSELEPTVSQCKAEHDSDKNPDDQVTAVCPQEASGSRDVKMAAAKRDVDKSGRTVTGKSVASDSNIQKDLLQKDKQGSQEKICTRVASVDVKSENVDEKPKSDSSQSDSPAKDSQLQQESVHHSGVVIRQKSQRGMLPCAQEIQEMAAKRQTVAFSGGEPRLSGEKSVVKRSSVVMADSGGTELAQMFSKFQRRASQKKQAEEGEEAKPHGDVQKDVTGSATTSKVTLESGSTKEGPAVGVGLGVKKSGKAMEASDKTSSSSKKVDSKTVTDEAKVDDSTSTRLTSDNQGRTKRINRSVIANSELSDNASSVGKVKQTSTVEPTKTTNVGKIMDKKENKPESKSLEKSKSENKESKSEVAEKNEAKQSTDRVIDNATAGTSISDVKSKPVKKSYSTSYKKTSSTAGKFSVMDPAGGNKMRSSSQSDAVEDAREVPVASVTKRGSISHTNPKTGSNTESSKNEGDVTIDVGGGQTKDAKSPSSFVTTASRSSLRSGSVQSGPKFTRSATIPCSDSVDRPASSAGPSGSASRSGSASGQGLVSSASRPVFSHIAQGTARSASLGGVGSKSTEAPTSVTSAEPMSKASEPTSKEAKTSSANKTSGSATESSSRGSSQSLAKTAPIIRSTGGSKNPPRSAVPDGDSTVEWLGMALQKTKAWTEGKIEIFEKSPFK